MPIARERAADDDLLEDSRVRVEEALQADGYVNARVTLTKDTSTPGVLIVTYNVTRGPRFRVDHLVIPAGLHMTTPTLEALLPIKPGDVYSKAKIEGALGSIRSEYRRRGFYQIQATADRETLPRSSEDGEVWVAVPLQITEGPQGLRHRDSVCARHDADSGARPAIPHAIEGARAVHPGTDDR